MCFTKQKFFSEMHEAISVQTFIGEFASVNIQHNWSVSCHGKTRNKTYAPILDIRSPLASGWSDHSIADLRTLYFSMRTAKTLIRWVNTQSDIRLPFVL